MRRCRCHRDRGRRGEAERVGAGDHHGGDREGERADEVLVGEEVQTAKVIRPAQTARITRYVGGAVGQPLAWRLGALGGLDQLDDLAERGVGADLRGPERSCRTG